MGGKSGGMSDAEKEAQRLQNEQLKEQQAQAKRMKQEQQALTKARRAGGAQASLLSGGESGERGGYKSLLG